MQVYRFGFWDFGSDDSVLFVHDTKQEQDYKNDIKQICAQVLSAGVNTLAVEFPVIIKKMEALGYRQVQPVNFCPFGGISNDSALDKGALRSLCQDADSGLLLAELKK